jgi:hypothetical protein
MRDVGLTRTLFVGEALASLSRRFGIGGLDLEALAFGLLGA